MAAKRNALGKGLTALLENESTDITSFNKKPVGSVSEIAINQVEANPFQPRTEFEEQALQQLSDSIKTHGVIQPITVRKMGFDKFQIISGERRTRAALIAGLATIPAFIRVANDQEMLEMALVENIQRQELNAMEIALSYQRLIEECSLKQEELAERVSKDRTTVVNYMRLLKLPDAIQVAIRDGKLSMGHARAIINIEDDAEQQRIFDEIINNSLSVRKVEDLVRSSKTGEKKIANTEPYFDEELTNYQDMFSNHFNSKVTFKLKNKGDGEIVIKYKSLNDLKRLVRLLEK